ncbi:hypothetical protein EMCRGX_G028881 [Ephydatia muelleri]|eukprot:Em0013g1045a
MQVFVRLETGRIIAIEVSPMDTIDNIKMKIRDKEGLSPESFILQHGDMEVEEGRTLNDYDIRNETTLYLKKNVLRPFTESLHTTSRSGKEVDTMELQQYVMYALLASVAITVLFLLVPDYAYFGLFVILVLLGVAIVTLAKAMKGEKAASVLR